MQETILTTLSKWIQSLDFQFSRKGENYIFICKELGINVNSISQDEFFVAMTNELLLKVEKFLRLESLGSDILRDLFGIKKKEEKQPKPSAKPEKPSKTEKTPEEVTEDWIRSEIQKAFLNGEMNKSKPRNIEDLFEQWKNQKQFFPDYTLQSPNRPLRPFEIICFGK